MTEISFFVDQERGFSSTAFCSALCAITGWPYLFSLITVMYWCNGVNHYGKSENSNVFNVLFSFSAVREKKVVKNGGVLPIQCCNWNLHFTESIFLVLNVNFYSGNEQWTMIIYFLRSNLHFVLMYNLYAKEKQT